MPVIWIPAMLRDLTDGEDQVFVQASTIRQAIEEVEKNYPGLKERLLQGDQLRPNISVVMDGTVSQLKLRQPLAEKSEVHFLFAIHGG
jgi:molybdopterin synthase sulfur carrier subunit